MNTHFDVVAVFEQWQCALYNALTTPLTLAEAARWVDHFHGHRACLHTRGDQAAACGAETALRFALIKLAATEVTSARMLARKVRVLVAHRAIWADRPLAAAMIDTAVANDAAALGLGADEEPRIRRTLRGDP